MCGETSYRGKCLTLAERGRNGRFKINDDDNYMLGRHVKLNFS